MSVRLILTVSGSDRPGLTQAVADAVFAAGGNWLESHLSKLGGMYVGSVLVEIAPDAATKLEHEVRAIDSHGLAVSVVPAGEDAVAGGEPLLIDLVGQDRPGIVAELTRLLAGLGVNIEEIDTEIENGAWSGELLFRGRVHTHVPSGTDPEKVRSALETISGDMMVDFTFG
ncbi:amino acid-binding protein [Novosphingobium sp. PC22D]|uniref:glycine cleavage system protein R n=1 Tax=Novosphingobium sp. PC22D TaxID=1962403 RepID=UPI000BF1AB9D|nr:ACT domain-containing protein [Novosphingobium sp. PC22D]PEQ10731.1 amino acid-binding protein [Novosphingobium sp. PC22D]